jgi:Ca2+-binding EF-hand superfamily protein
MKRNKLKTVVLGLGIALFMSNYSFGQSQDRQERKEPPTFAQLLKEMDANEDGKLAKDELKGPLKDDFTKIDTDEDGYISEKEFKNAPKPERKERNKK